MKRLLGLGIVLALAGAGCSDASSGEPARVPTGSRSVTQGGPQDIGYFRSIVTSGEVPRPNTIEPVGFFAEHAVDLPPADCGDSVCTHAMLAVAPGIDLISNWSMAFVAMNTPVDPRELARPSTHVIVVVEDTARTRSSLLVADNLRTLTNELFPEDRISLIRFAARAETLASGLEITDTELASASAQFRGVGETAALYDALALAAEIVETDTSGVGAHRIVLQTSGIADAGITDTDRIISLAESLGRAGAGISVIGVGETFRPETAMQISEAGGGSYYYAEAGADLEEIYRLEGRTSLHPLATDFELLVEAGAGYRVGRIYGARRAWAEQEAAHLTSPVLMIGNRTGAADVEEGRRGGGGGLFVELIADAALGAEIGPGRVAFTATATWTDSATGEPVEQRIEITNELAPGENPSGMFPFFSDPLRGKAFMMLNMYLSLRTSTELYHEGDCAQSLGVVPALEPTYLGWQGEYEDPDIEADWMLLDRLQANIRGRCAGVEPQLPESQMGCFSD